MDLSRSREVFLAVLLFLTAAVPATSQVAGDLRLSTGRGASNGRLQVYIGGEWGEICDTGFGMNEADVACHQLGFIEAVSVGDDNSTFGTVSRVLIHNIDCPNNDFLHLLRCGHQITSIDCADDGYVILNCNATPIWNDPYPGQLRLMRGSYPSQGLVEVYCNGQWGTICDDQFGQEEADTVCRQLGYTEADQYDRLLFRGTTGQPIWLDDVVCPSVKECLHSCQRCPPTQLHNCVHSEDITIQCSFNTLHSKIGANQTTCDLEENDNRPRDGEIRLVNVTSGQIANSSGVVEVRYESQWRRICPPSSSVRQSYLSTSACRQLGFNRAVGNNILINNVTISQLSFPSPTAQWHVLRNGFFLTSDCSSSFTVTCDNNGANYAGQVRLRGGQYPSEGRVEIYLNNQWGTICADVPIAVFDKRQLGSHLKDEADTVCRQLGYTSAVVFSEGRIPGNGSVWVINPSCPSFRTTNISCFKDCYYQYSPFSVPFCSHSQDFAVNCTYVAADSSSNPSGNERTCVDTRPPTTPLPPFPPFPPVGNTLPGPIAVAVFIIMLTISLIISIVAIVCVACVTRCGKKARRHRTCINTTEVDAVRFVPQSAASTSSTSENEKQSIPL